MCWGDVLMCRAGAWAPARHEGVVRRGTARPSGREENPLGALTVPAHHDRCGHAHGEKTRRRRAFRSAGEEEEDARHCSVNLSGI